VIPHIAHRMCSLFGNERRLADWELKEARLSKLERPRMARGAFFKYSSWEMRPLERRNSLSDRDAKFVVALFETRPGHSDYELT